jgi:hypothetical protein
LAARQWNQYRQLYGHSPERVAFLNEVAGHFFGMVQDVLLDDVLLHLTRLTDPPKRNLTLKRLFGFAPDPALGAELDRLVPAACEACDRARTTRNQRIAHTDFTRAVAGTFEDYPSRADVEAALRAIRAVLHRLETHYWQTATAYERFLPAGGDADGLVSYLLKGVRADERQMERFIQGKPLPEDLEPEGELPVG